MFPSLVNCCTLDWFTEWPEEALIGVGRGQLSDFVEEVGISENLLTNLVDSFKVREFADLIPKIISYFIHFYLFVFILFLDYPQECRETFSEISIRITQNQLCYTNKLLRIAYDVQDYHEG